MALANLAKGHWPIQRDIAEAGGVESIVLLLGGEIVDPNAPADPEQDAAAAAKGKGGAPAPPDYSKIPWRGREAAARALESLADLNIDVQAYAARAGCVAPLMDLLRHEEFSAKEWAARAIAVLAQLSRNIAGIAESPGGMQPLVDVLKAQHAGCQEAGCIALHNLAVGNDDVRQRLVEMGALEQLAAVLKGDNLVCRMQAARAVTVMAQADAAKQQLVAAGVIQGLIQQLSDPSHPTEVLESAARCVTQLSAGQAPIQAEMAKGGVVPLLVTLLESKTEEIRDSAAIALWSLASHPAVKQSLAEAGAMDKLVRVVGQGAAKLLKQPVPRSHDLEEGSDDVEREVLEAVRGLVDLLCSGTDGGKKDAAWGLGEWIICGRSCS